MKTHRAKVAFVAAGALALAGCGGGGNSAGTNTAARTTTAAKSAAKPNQKAAAGSRGAKAAPSAGATAKHPTGKVSLAQVNATIVRTYGEAGSSSDRDQAAQAAAAFLSARAAGNWQGACSSLAQWLRSQLESYAQTTGGSPQQRCAKVLEGYEAKVPQATRRRQAAVHALTLRVKGDEALLIYRNSSGVQYDIPMRREGGQWLVGAVAPSALPM